VPNQFWGGALFPLVLPVIVYQVRRRVCDELKRSEAHPRRGFAGTIVRQGPSGGYEPLRVRV
jgi:hypothetical protein